MTMYQGNENLCSATIYLRIFELYISASRSRSYGVRTILLLRKAR